MKKMQLKDVEFSLGELQQRRKVSYSLLYTVVYQSTVEKSRLYSQFMVYVPACLSGITSNDCRDNKNGEGEEDSGVRFERQQGREGCS